ncbi:MAG: hypothetical protein ACYTGL_29770 [Planctomycetota bacterium]
MRAIGLRYLPVASLQRTWIEQILHVGNADLQREVVFSLQSSNAEWRDELLRKIASDSHCPTNLRADAVAGLATRAEHPQNTHLLLRLIASEKRALRIESLRALRGRAAQNMGVRNALLRQIQKRCSDPVDDITQFEIDEQLVMALAGVDDRDYPGLSALRVRVLQQRPDSLETWQAKLRNGGNADAGRRVFFHPKTASCRRCHRASGRGSSIASDLTGVGRAASRRSLIESIVEPGRSIPGPYVTWTLITDSGKVHSGLVLTENSESVVIGTADGRMAELPSERIVSRQPQRSSLMPDNLVDQLTVEEFRDLLAFLIRF